MISLYQNIGRRYTVHIRDCHLKNTVICITNLSSAPGTYYGAQVFNIVPLQQWISQITSLETDQITAPTVNITNNLSRDWPNHQWCYDGHLYSICCDCCRFNLFGFKTGLHGVIITERLDTLCNLHKRLINGIYTNESLIKDSSFNVIRRPHRFIILFQKRSPVPTESTLYILL